MDPRVDREARILAEYLIPGAFRTEVPARYHVACEASGLLPANVDDTVLRFVRNHPLLIGPIEAACAQIAADHPLRKKLLLMLAVLETIPDLSKHFLPLRPPDRSPFLEGLRLLSLGSVAVSKAALGIFLLYWLGRGGRQDG